MRGCKCAMSIKASRKSSPTFSSCSVLCCAVRAGQVSTRQKIITMTAAMKSAIKMNASGQEMPPDLADFAIERWMLGVCFAEALIEHEQEHEQEHEERAKFPSKKLPPPTPDRREGRLFPPEQS